MRFERLVRTGCMAIALSLAATAGAVATDAPPELSLEALGSEDRTLAAALDDLLRAAQERPRDSEAWKALGLALEASELFEDAASVYRWWATLSPADPRPSYRLGRLRDLAGDPAGASAFFEQSLALDGSIPWSWWRAGFAALALGRMDEAEGAFEKARELAADAPEATAGLTRLALESGDVERALEESQRLLDRWPDPYSNFLRGTALRLNGDLVAARQMLLKSDGVQPAWTSPWDQEVSRYSMSLSAGKEVAVGLLRRGDFERALELLLELERLDPDDASVQSNLASALISLGRPSEAETRLEAALGKHPGLVSLTVNLAAARAAQGRLVEAESVAREALELNPYRTEPLDLLGDVLAQLGRPREAMEALVEADRFDPGQQHRLQRLAALQEQLGEWSRAAVTYRRLIRLAGGRRGAWLALARAELEAGETARAVQAFERARQLGAADDPRFDELARRLGVKTEGPDATDE